MLYQLQSNTGHTLVVEAPAIRDDLKTAGYAIPHALRMWVHDVWLPSLRATVCEVAEYQPVTFTARGLSSASVATVVAEVSR